MSNSAQKIMHENFKITNGLLEGREWFFDHLTIPDIYFFWCFRRAKQFEIDILVYENCNAHSERAAGRESVQKLSSFEAEALAGFTAQ